MEAAKKKCFMFGLTYDRICILLVPRLADDVQLQHVWGGLAPGLAGGVGVIPCLKRGCGCSAALWWMYLFKNLKT